MRVHLIVLPLRMNVVICTPCMEHPCMSTLAFKKGPRGHPGLG